ncbi:hypothetical protein B5X24_HaOG212882 [Helicoverpa armigera]|uniref:Uncharacterized protein n=1 Tax=Helicoverpa armigera TaxID=29058 RepID=A0A2W1BCR7_HELAM|nr:hypothetical protein B5X24_HaOG212882 [Helicoverpa armigera]
MLCLMNQTNGQSPALQAEAASPPGGAEHSGSSSSSGGSRAGTLSCMMNEMARTLARRRAHLDKAEESSTDNSEMMREMRHQLNQIKKEILDAMKAEFARR